MILIIIVMISLLVAPTLSIYIYILIKDINFIKNKHKMRTHHEEELVQENKNSLQY